MKRITWLILLTASICKGQLSEQAYISVITCGPSTEELYSAFGHNAFRIYDPVKNIDVVCNYGTFDFNQPNFYLNFALGNNLYKLSIEEYRNFENRYVYENRFIHEQILNLTEEQKQQIFAFLRENSLPENASYQYDYFYDNCSTKLRDVLQEVLGNDLIFDGSYITADLSIRELTDIYIKRQFPWGDLGIDICLGLPMDKVPDRLEYMFLPPNIEAGFDHATVTENGATVPLVKEKRILYEARDEVPPKSLPHPLYVTGAIALLAIVLTVWDFRRKKTSTWFDVVLFAITGLIGVLLVFLWFFTNHRAAANNFNLLWAFPGHLVAALLIFRSPGWLRHYFLFATILTGLTLISWPVLPQLLPYAMIPFVFGIGLRAWTQYYIRNRKAQIAG